MENIQDDNQKRFFDFARTIQQRVADIGAKRRSTGRDAQLVVEQLYKQSSGDASKVADEDIQNAFDTIPGDQDGG